MTDEKGARRREWTLDIDLGEGVERIGLLVVCDVDDDRLAHARLYVALPHSSQEDHPHNSD